MADFIPASAFRSKVYLMDMPTLLHALAGVDGMHGNALESRMFVRYECTAMTRVTDGAADAFKGYAQLGSGNANPSLSQLSGSTLMEICRARPSTSS